MYFKDLDLTGAKLLNPNRHENSKYLLNNKIYRRFDAIHIFIIKYYLDGFKKYYNNFELHSDFIIRDFTPGQTSASVKNIQKLKSYFFKCFGDGDLFYPDDFLDASNSIGHIFIDEEATCGLLLKRFRLLDSMLVCQKLDINESELKNAIDSCRGFLDYGEIIRLYR